MIGNEPTRELLRGIVETVPDGLVVADHSGTIVLVNAETERLFGYGPGELVGRPVEMLVPAQMRRHHAHLRSEFSIHPHPRRMGDPASSLQGRRKDGTEFPVEISLSPLKCEEGDCVVAVVRDSGRRLADEERVRQAKADLAVYEERERIARDLHDNVIQEIFAVGLTVQSMVGASADPDTAARLESIIDSLDGTIRDIRETIFDLKHPADGGEGRFPDIERICREKRSLLGYTPSLSVEGPLDGVPSRTREHLVATLNEALTNVARHADASNVEVGVIVDDEVTLVVRDDGSGIPDEVSETGHGLRNMAARALDLGGSFRVGRVDDAGTVVEWRVPTEVGAQGD